MTEGRTISKKINELETQGIKYAGSKLKLISQIRQMASQLEIESVFDGFSGTTRVSQAFAQMGYCVHANDLSVWSEVFGRCYLLNTRQPEYYKSLIEHLNSMPPEDGWFTEHYGGLDYNGSAVQPDGSRKPWQIHNTRKLDAIRTEIDRLALSCQDKAVALTSLIHAMDQVDNTLGHYAAYLKDWSPRSYNNVILRVPALFVNTKVNLVTRGDVFDQLQNTSFDLAYFDPPYGSNNEKMPPSRIRYNSYYHLWTTICLNDRPQLFGKAARRLDSSDSVSSSVFEEFRRNKNTGRFISVEAIERLIQNTNAKYMIFSYSSGGRATADELYDVFNANGKLLSVQKVDYKKNVMASMKWTNQWLRDKDAPNQEYLFLIEKIR